MNQTEYIEQIVREVLASIKTGSGNTTLAPPLLTTERQEAEDLPDITDITDPLERNKILVNPVYDREALVQMKRATHARIGVGKAGPRLKTRTLLTLLADHAAAQDAVFTDVSPAFIEKLGLFAVQTLCKNRDEYLTRPDLGRQFSQESLRTIKESCKYKPAVQVYASDGLSSQAIEANLENILPALINGLNQYNIDVGTPFFVKYGRVPAMDVVSETLDSEVTCVLIGERPGLATSESMSVYIAYRASPGMPESRRTVVSNIHKGGIFAVEAGAYIADVIKKILDLRKSGVELIL